jgi:hypothetical protein
MDDDQRNTRILAAPREFMESIKLYRLPGHKLNATDLGMWKLASQEEFLCFSVHLLADLVVGVK